MSGALLLGACSKGSGSAQTTGTPDPAGAAATSTSSGVDANGVEHLHFEYGPIDIQPGQNSIEFSDGQVPGPTSTATSSASGRTWCAWTAPCRASMCCTCTTACG